MPELRTDIVLLGSPGDSTSIVYHHLVRRFGRFPVILESPVSKAHLLKVRIRKLGFSPVVSQIAFLTLVRPLLSWEAKNVVSEHCSRLGLDRSKIPPNAITSVESVNNEACRKAIIELAPRVVVVNGTRIIGTKTLSATGAQFINTHAGITPRYRGAHGGYWALRNFDAKNCGVTVHLVDSGIDTGNILGQATIAPSAEDNFITYPYLQLAAALPILEASVAHGLQKHLEGRKAEGPSGVWYHPGICEYLLGRLKGIR
jgi:folate-dependent phosphoribosylglycinamide formyltransferase PurN